MFEWTDHVLAAERRRADRAALDLPLRLLDREGRAYEARLLNLSTHGLMAECDAPLLERAPLRLQLPLIDWVRGDVAWVLGRRCGVQFRLPLTDATLERLLSLT